MKYEAAEKKLKQLRAEYDEWRAKRSDSSEPTFELWLVLRLSTYNESAALLTSAVESLIPYAPLAMQKIYVHLLETLLAKLDDLDDK